MAEIPRIPQSRCGKTRPKPGVAGIVQICRVLQSNHEGECIFGEGELVAPVPLPLERAVLVQLGDVKHVHLKLDVVGRDCKLLFDGVEQDNVFSVQVKAEVNSRTAVLVGFYPTEVTIEGAGQVVKLDRSADLESLVEQAFQRGFEAGQRRRDG